MLSLASLLDDSLLSVKTVESIREEVSLHSRNLVLVLREDYIWIRLEVSLKVRMCYSLIECACARAPSVRAPSLSISERENRIESDRFEDSVGNICG